MATRVAKDKDFAINTKEVNCFEVEEVNTRTLSAKDSNALLDLLSSDVEPTEAAVEAYTNYKRNSGDRSVRD